MDLEQALRAKGSPSANGWVDGNGRAYSRDKWERERVREFEATSPRCGTCKHAYPLSHHLPTECRRHAPIGMANQYRAEWPRIDRDELCGDWEKGPVR